MDRINNDPTLFGILRQSISDSGLEVTLDPCYLQNDCINENMIAIIKLDEHYNTQIFARPPKMTDFMVVTKNQNLRVIHYELKNTNDLKQMKADYIAEKMAGINTALADFPPLDSINSESNDVYAELITPAMNIAGLSRLLKDRFLLLKPIRIGTKMVAIIPKQPYTLT